VAHLTSLRATVETNHTVEDVRMYLSRGATLLDLSAWEAARITGGLLPTRYRSRLERFRHAPGVFKIDYALDGPIPWKADACRGAGTVHLGGTFEEIADAEHQVATGRIPIRPFVLLTQPSLFDPERAPAGKHTAWAYCHVPFGCTVDMTDAIENQIERFAPGFRDLVLARHVLSPQGLHSSNANLMGGDINGGAADLGQLLARPVLTRPYEMRVPGLYLCSSSTPPGGGVHGMCGVHAAHAALRWMKRIS
jgi:phytoene dehydrogenase-like protein